MSEQQEVAKREETRPGIAVVPPVDVVEDNTGITLTADLPGVPTDKLTVRVDGDGLLIEGEVALDTPEGIEAVYAEVQTPRYRRAFTLSRDLDTAKSAAACSSSASPRPSTRNRARSTSRSAENRRAGLDGPASLSRRFAGVLWPRLPLCGDRVLG